MVIYILSFASLSIAICACCLRELLVSLNLDLHLFAPLPLFPSKVLATCY